MNIPVSFLCMKLTWIYIYISSNNQTHKWLRNKPCQCIHNKSQCKIHDIQPLRNMGFEWMVLHYDDVIMGTMSSQITSLTIVYSTVYSGSDRRKYQSFASLDFVRGIHRGPVNSPHKWPVTRKIFPFDDVIMAWNYSTGRPPQKSHTWQTNQWFNVETNYWMNTILTLNVRGPS